MVSLMRNCAPYQRTYILPTPSTTCARSAALRHQNATFTVRRQRFRGQRIYASSSDSFSGDGAAFDLAEYYEAKLENGTQE